MIKIHGMQKIAERLKADMSLLKEGQQVLIEWPGHFAIMCHKSTHNRFDFTIHGARASETNALMTALDVKGWDANMIPSLSWNLGK